MNMFVFILILSFLQLLCGYGYMGDLPELGKTTKPLPQQEEIKKQVSPNPVAIIAPRVSTGHNVSKYKDYIADIRQIEQILVEIKAILEKKDNPKNKIQLFNAKAFCLSLYIDKFKEKYGDSDQQYYESYKQLIYLDSYLKTVGHSNAGEAVKPINTVIALIGEAKSHGL